MKLNLHDLGTDQHHFLTLVAGLNFAHAASVCYESQGHAAVIDMADVGHYKTLYSVERLAVNEEMKRTWGDEEYTTEQGAYGVAFMVASTEIKYKAISKSRKKSGIDYWLGTKDSFLFQEKARLEVSGIRSATDYELNSRYETKMKQSEKSDATGLPALIVIVDFGKPRVKTGLRNVL